MGYRPPVFNGGIMTSVLRDTIHATFDIVMGVSMVAADGLAPVAGRLSHIRSPPPSPSPANVTVSGIQSAEGCFPDSTVPTYTGGLGAEVPFVNFSITEIFDLAKETIRLLESLSYLAGVTVAQLKCERDVHELTGVLDNAEKLRK